MSTSTNSTGLSHWNISTNMIHLLVKGLWRHRWKGLVVAWTVTLAGTFVLNSLKTDIYESYAVIDVGENTALGQLFKGMALGSDTKRQVQLVKRTVLSKPNLLSLGQYTNLIPSDSTATQLDKLVGEIKAGININALGNDLLQIRYRDHGRVRTKNVLNAIRAMFTENYFSYNSSRFLTYRNIIDSQVKLYEQQLIEIESQIGELIFNNRKILGSTTYNDRLIQAPQSGRSSTHTARWHQNVGPHSSEGTKSQHFSRYIKSVAFDLHGTASRCKIIAKSTRTTAKS